MLIHYLKAAAGDVAYIKKLIEKDISILDQPWEGSESDYDRQFELNTSLKYSASGLLLLSTAAFSWPVALLALSANTACHFINYNNQKQSYILKHKNWTLLQFAAETGKIEVALLLIRHGANTNNSFLQIAADNNHHEFVDACSHVIELKAQEVENNNLTQENTTLQTQVEDTNDQYLEIQTVNLIYKIENCLERYFNLEATRKYKTVLDEIDLQANSVNLSPLEEMKRIRDSNYLLYKNAQLTLIEIFSIIELESNLQDQISTRLNNRIYSVTIKLEHYENLYFDAHKEYLDLYASMCPKAQPQPQPQKNKSAFFNTPTEKRTIYPFDLIDRDVDYIPGDCFFSAVIASRPDKNWNSQQLRQSIHDELLNSRVEYEEIYVIRDKDGNFFIDIWDPILRKAKTITFKSYEDYCKHVLKDTMSVDHAEITAFAKTNKVCCVIVCKETSDVVVEQYRWASDENPPIFLGRENNNHYVSLECPAQSTWQEVMQEMNRKAKSPIF